MLVSILKSHGTDSFPKCMWAKESGDESSQIVKKLSTTVGHSFSLKIKEKRPTISLMNYVNIF